MDEQSFNEEFKKLKAIQEEYINKNEDTLLFYIECLMKMHKAYYKIYNTDMLSYIKQIMKNSFSLFIEYFSKELEGLKKIKELEHTKQNAKNIVEFMKDIEKSVVEFGEMFEAIINSTNGADRIILQSAPVDIGLRYTSPKLCAYYSSLLNALAKLLDNDGKYAFSVYPSLRSGAQTHIMFSCLQEHGKVCIIQIPESIFADVDYVRFVLLHELYHILPSKIRFREDRSYKFGNILVSGLFPKIIKEHKFLGNNADVRMQEFLFSDLIDKYEKDIKEKKDDFKWFYSYDLKKYYEKTILVHLSKLQNMTLANYLKEFGDKAVGKNFDDFEESYKNIEIMWSSIIKSVQNQIIGDSVKNMCDFYMQIFREPFSDLLSVISLRVKPVDFYRNLLQRKKPTWELEKRHILLFRVFFVTETLKGIYKDKENLDLSKNQIKYINEWSDDNITSSLRSNEDTMLFVEKIANLIGGPQGAFYKKIPIKSSSEGKSPQENDNDKMNGLPGGKEESKVPEETQFEYNEFWMGEDIIKLYLSYYEKCARQFFQDEMIKKKEFKKFRKSYMLKSTDKLKLIKSIMNWQEQCLDESE